MTNLMCHQHIVNLIRGTLPHRQSQHTGVDIKAGSFNILVLNHEVFSGKQFGKVRLDFVIDGHCSVSYEVIIQKNPAV